MVMLESWVNPDIPSGLQHVSRELLMTWLEDLTLLAAYAEVLGPNSVATGGGPVTGIRPVVLSTGAMLVGTAAGVMPLSGDGIVMMLNGMPAIVPIEVAMVFNLGIRGML